MTDENL